jgi:hypothetical protein
LASSTVYFFIFNPPRLIMKSIPYITYDIIGLTRH